MKYKSVSYSYFNSIRRFGIELEMGHHIPKSKVSSIIRNYSSKEVLCTGYKLSSENDYWHVKDDSTCGIFGRNGPKGVEVASYIAQGNEDIDHLAFVGRMLSLSGCKTNSNCGYHIHAEAKDLDVNTVGILVANWLKIEPWVENMLTRQRRDSRYCKSLYKLKIFDNSKTWKPQDLFILFSPKNLVTFENEERRVSLNLLNYVKHVLSPGPNSSRCTLELRCPEGTLEYNEIKNWIYFFINFIDKSSSKEMPRDLMPCSNIEEFLRLSGLNHEGSQFYIFSRDFFDLRNWILKRLVANGSAPYRNSAKKKISFLDEDALDKK